MWTKNNKQIKYGALPGGIPSTSTVYSLIKNTVSNIEFYELESAEVLDLLLHEKDLPELKNGEKDFSLIGAIKARMVNSQQNIHIDELPWIMPINSNIKHFPLIGEYVIIAIYLGKFYYFNNLNIIGSVNANTFPGLSSISAKLQEVDKAEIQITGTPNKAGADAFKIGNIFIENQFIRQVQPEEGDIIFNGRFGNSIKFGSDIINDNKKSPNIILRAGQLLDAEKFNINVDDIKDYPLKPVVENINADGSSIWITTNQKVQLNPSTEEFAEQIYSTLENTISIFDGKQIILNSDRIIFNSKVGEILGFAKNGIEFSTEKTFGIASKGNTIINSPNLLLGINGLNKKTIVETVEFLVQNEDGNSHINTKHIQLGVENFEPVVLGQTMKELLTDLANIVLDFSKLMQTVGVPGVPATKPIPPMTPNLPMLLALDKSMRPVAPKFIEIIQRLSIFKINLTKTLSRVVKVE